jgi:hypothetical protein
LSFLGITLVSAQTEADSLRQIQIDSLNRLSLVIHSFYADNSLLQSELDTNKLLITDHEEAAITLNNFYSPSFHLPGRRIKKHIYTDGINSMHYSTRSFDHFQFFNPNKTLAEIALHRVRAFSNSQAGFQDNFDIHLLFARQFRNRVLWNFSYDKDNYKGIYLHDRKKNSLFTTGIHYKSITDRFHLNLIFRDERHTYENNWGVVSDTFLLNSNFSIRESVPVNSVSAGTILFTKTIGGNLDFPLSSATTGFAPHVFIKSFYTNYCYEYSDNDTRHSEHLYRNYWIDSASIKNRLNQKKWTNSFKLNVFPRNQFEAEIGFRSEYTQMDHDTLGHNLFVYNIESHLAYEPNSSIKLSAHGNLTRFEDQLSSSAFATIRYDNMDLISCEFKLFTEAFPIPYIYRKLVLNKTLIWQADYSNEFTRETGLSTSLRLHKYLPLELQASISEFSNFIYFDSLSLPRSMDNIRNVGLKIILPIDFGKLRLDSKFNYDFYNPDQMGITGWNSTHNLSIHTSLFKKVIDARMGLRMKLYNFNNTFRYNPVLTSYQQSDLPNSFIYSAGMFFHFKISDFSLLLDFDNIDSFWLKKRPTLVHSYPLYDFYFSLGIHWRFLN